MAKPLDKSSLQETRLLDKMSRIEENSSGYFAVHVHLSRLRPSNRQPHFIQIAARAFDPLVSGADATVHVMTNQDIILICREVMVEDIDPFIEKVRGLFTEDPLTTGEDEFEDQLTTWYDLASQDDFSALLSVVSEMLVKAEQILEEQRKLLGDDGKDKGDPLNARNLAAINQQLQSTRIADLIRQQTCIRITPGQAGAIIFHEHFVAVNELKERIAPGVNVFSSAWLFQYLTETLDKRVLAVIGRKNFAELKDPISLNLNIATVLSRDFANFNRQVGDGAQKLVIEFQIIDVFADMNTYGYARDMLKDRGYKVLIDGVSPLTLQFFDPATLQPDFIKVAWGKEFEDADEDPAALIKLKETMAHAGRDSMILARVDSEKAIKWGLTGGITRFQGYFIDKLVQAMARSRVRPKAKAKRGVA